MVDKKKEAVPGAAVITAISGVMAETHTIPKKGHNKFHGYDYATEEDALRVIRPAMVKAGLVLLPDVETVSEIDQYGNTHIIVRYYLAHTSGDIFPFPIRLAGAGNDKNKNGVGDKGTFKALTGTNKYALFKIFQVATGDEPESDSYADANPGAAAQSTQAAPPRAPADGAGGGPLTEEEGKNLLIWMSEKGYSLTQLDEACLAVANCTPDKFPAEKKFELFTYLLGLKPDETPK
jgi:hypothetical protein